MPPSAAFLRVRAAMADGGHNLSTAELLALLRDASLKPDSIAEEMECAGAHRCTAEQIAEARELLGLLQQERTAQSAGLASEGAAAEAEVARRIAALPEPLALALVRAAGEAQRQDALVELAAAPRKPLAKEAKRELQRLKQRGFQVQELKPRGEPVLKPPPEAEAPACYASSIDAYGERAVWWSRATRGGVEVVQAVISDVKGILAIDALALSRRNFRDFIKRLPRQGGPVTSVEVPKDHARWLIAQACSGSSATILRRRRSSVPWTRSAGLLISTLGYRGLKISQPPSVSKGRLPLQLKTNRDRGCYFHGLAIQQRGFISPLAHRIEGRLRQRRNVGVHHLGVEHGPFFRNHRAHHHHTLHAELLQVVRIDGPRLSDQFR